MIADQKKNNASRAFCMSVLAGVSLLATLGGCSRDESPRASSSATTAPAATLERAAAAHGASTEPCAEDDIECVEHLYQLEETLFAYEAGVDRQLPSDARPCWKLDSELFRRTVNQCSSVECKETALLARIASLHFLQPEPQRTSLTLPDAPPLIGVLAPLGDAPPAPAPDRQPDLELRGELIHAMKDAAHMGIAVRTDQGDHVFIYDMDIGSSPAQNEVLGLVGTTPTKSISVRGYSKTARDGVANFDPEQCRWAHELE